MKLSAQSKCCLVLLCLFLTAIRVSGAHMHYCHDGSEPPVSMHFDSDIGLHHFGEPATDSTAVPHSDVDVSLVLDAVSKQSDGGAGGEALLASIGTVVHVVPISNRQFISVDSPLAPDRWWAIVPPARGPPA